MSYSLPMPIIYSNPPISTPQYTIHVIGEGASFIDECKSDRIGIDMSKQYELLVHDDDGNLVFDFHTDDKEALPGVSSRPVSIRFEVQTNETFLPSAMKLVRSSGPNSRVTDQLEFAGTTYQGSVGDMIIAEGSGKLCHILFI